MRIARCGTGCRTLVEFGEFARVRGANTLEDLPVHLDAFVAKWAARQQRAHLRGDFERVGREVRGPIEQMLRLAVPGFTGRGRPHRRVRSPRRRRGSSSTWPPSVVCGRCRYWPTGISLDRFEDYLVRVGVTELSVVSPTLLAAFVAERRATGLAKTTVRETCGVLRVFLRYAHREGVLAPGPE